MRQIAPFKITSECDRHFLRTLQLYDVVCVYFPIHRV